MAIPTKLIYKGLKANLPASRDANSFYLCTDSRELYFGTELYTDPVRFYTSTKPEAPAQGVLYIEETTGVGEVWNGSAWKPVLKGYATTIAEGADDTTVPTSKAVKDYVDPLTAISEEEGNAVERKADGLYVPTPAAADTYEIEKAANSGEYAAIYNLMRKPGGTGEAVQAGVSINIPKDMVVQSGSVVEVSDDEAGTAEFPASAGTYIKLVLQNVADPLWIDVGSLIEYVTGGTATDGIITVAVDPTSHVATATINDGTITLAKLHTDVQTAIGKAHDHSNKELLDTYTQTEENLADAVAKKHEHTNKDELDKFVAGDKDKLDAVYSALEVGAFPAD